MIWFPSSTGKFAKTQQEYRQNTFDCQQNNTGWPVKAISAIRYDLPVQNHRTMLVF